MRARPDPRPALGHRRAALPKGPGLGRGCEEVGCSVLVLVLGVTDGSGRISYGSADLPSEVKACLLLNL